MYTHDPQQVLDDLIAWGGGQQRVRAMLMTSTRAVPHATVDVLSDYDIVLVVDQVRPFYDDRAWLNAFGDVLVSYWDPIFTQPEYGVEQTGNVIQFADGLKIDFSIWPRELLAQIVAAPALPQELDAGYRMLLDKDGLTEGLLRPTFRAYIPTKPSEAQYLTAIEDFFSDVPYVGKCLLRGELLPLKWCLDYDMKLVYLRQMLEWHVQRESGWRQHVGNLGKGLKKHMSPALWAQLEGTFAGAGSQENWAALFRTIELYRRLAVDVGDDLGYSYPYELDRRVTEFVRTMKDGEPPGDTAPS